MSDETPREIQRRNSAAQVLIAGGAKTIHGVDPAAAIKRPISLDQALRGLLKIAKSVELHTTLTLEEMRWTFTRIQQLIRNEGRSREESKRIIREEAKTKPWLNAKP